MRLSFLREEKGKCFVRDAPLTQIEEEEGKVLIDSLREERRRGRDGWMIQWEKEEGER